MNFEQLIIAIVIGGIAGWLAGKIMKDGAGGILGNIIVGVVGGLIGSWLFRKLNISVGGKWMGPLITSTVGAVVLLFLIGLVKKK